MSKGLTMKSKSDKKKQLPKNIFSKLTSEQKNLSLKN